ncbi:hypothetical protein HDU76_002264 [Blyttiomyces sp. JEL0837]|nr:hypothetical protein HDU76_002264 [Blyttiomyces sp. JEL0837]
MLGNGMDQTPSRKRPREQEDEQDDRMELDQSHVTLPLITGLSAEEDRAAKSLAIERLKNVLFVDPDDLKVPNEEDSFIFTQNRPPFIPPFISTSSTSHQLPSTIRTRNNLIIPSFLYYLIEWVTTHSLKDSKWSPNLLSITPSRERIESVMSMIGASGLVTTLGSLTANSTIEVLFLLTEYLRGFPAIFKKNHFPVLRGILSLNNATGRSRVAGGSVCIPTETTIKLLRDAILLLSASSRGLLYYLLDFLNDISRASESTSKSTTLRQIAQNFGPLLIGESRKTVHMSASKNEWSTALCELLMHAHGVTIGRISNSTPTSSTTSIGSTSLLWKVSSSLKDQIKKKMTVSRTPSRASCSPMMSPRGSKSMPRTIANQASKRLFTPSPKKPLVLQQSPGSPKLDLLIAAAGLITSAGVSRANSPEPFGRGSLFGENNSAGSGSPVRSGSDDVGTAQMASPNFVMKSLNLHMDPSAVTDRQTFCKRLRTTE